MKYVISFLVGIFLSIAANAQYKLNKVCFVDTNALSTSVSPSENVAFRYRNGVLRYYKSIKFSDKHYLTVHDIDTTTFRVVKSDTVENPFDMSRITDVLPLRNFDVIVSFGRILVYNRLNKLVYFTRYVCGNMLDFSSADILSDSTILLSTISSYHPNDGFAGINMHVFNVKSLQVEKSRLLRAPGTALSLISPNRIATLNNRIYFVAPLSGALKVFDKNLNEIEQRSISFTPNIAKNMIFERKADSVFYGACDTIYKAISLHYGEESVQINQNAVDVFSKNHEVTIGKIVRDSFDYIEKFVPLNDSCLIMVICRKGTEFSKRDLFYYNVRTGIVYKKSMNWITERQASCRKIEDYLPIFVSNSKHIMPCFVGNKVYAGTFVDVESFCPSEKDSLDLQNFKMHKQNGYKWKLLEYSLH